MRILVVDDERQITRVLRTALESHGYQVAIAADGIEALRQVDTFHPDLVHAESGWRGVDQGHPTPLTDADHRALGA
jgi:two-component system KDP operon response regulator KdpE